MPRELHCFLFLVDVRDPLLGAHFYCDKGIKFTYIHVSYVKLDSEARG